MELANLIGLILGLFVGLMILLGLVKFLYKVTRRERPTIKPDWDHIRTKMNEDFDARWKKRIEGRDKAFMSEQEARSILEKINETPYTILGLANKESTQEEIKAAFKKLILKWHPDRNPGNIHAEEMSKKIIAAYTLLIKRGNRPS